MPQAKGFRTFLVIWIGQVVSMFGSALTAFALGVWVFNQTGSATLFTLIAVFATLPGILLSPIAGALVDRWDRRWAMILSDGGAALATLVLIALLASGRLEVWHIYFLVAFASTFSTLQFPAFSAAITLLVSREHYGRLSGMMQFGEAASTILAPAAAGFVMVAAGLVGVVTIDLATFVFAVVMVLLVTVPRPPVSAEAGAGQGSLLKEAAFGWRYIRERPGLMSLLGYFACLNLVIPMGMVLATPLVLSFGNAADAGVVVGVGAGGGTLAGSLVMSAWGGPKRKITGILGFAPLMSVGLLIAGLRPSVVLVTAGLFVTFFAIPIINGSSQAIWQSKVEPAVQGRVFAMRRMVAQATAPLAFLVAGPLAEFVFEPLLTSGGPLAGSLGRLVGTGPGRGTGLMLVVMGAAFFLVTLSASGYRRLREVEEELPDMVPDAVPGQA